MRHAKQWVKQSYKTLSHLFDKRQQEIGEVEVAKVIRANLHLEPVLGPDVLTNKRRVLGELTNEMRESPGQRAHHHPGVVDQDVDLGHCLLQPLHRGLDAGQARQVHLLHADIPLGLAPEKTRTLFS